MTFHVILVDLSQAKIWTDVLLKVLCIIDTNKISEQFFELPFTKICPYTFQ